MYRANKAFEIALEQALGERVRADGGCAVDLWSALANVRWYGPDGETVGYSFRAASSVVEWVYEDGDELQWYCSGPPAVVAPWIATAMREKGWKFSLIS